MPKVSVIIPVYGVEKYIERCARSLFEQTLEDIEFIFVDDCTPDKSIEILKKIHEEYPHRKNQVIIHRMEKNSGQAAVRKWGMLNATGDYVIHCDSDDWVDITMYEKMYKKAVEEDSDVIICDYYKSDTINHTEIKVLKKPMDHDTYFRALLCHKLQPSVWNKLVRRDLCKDNLVFPTQNMGEDLVLMVQIIKRSKKISYLSQPLYYYYSNAESITGLKSFENVKKRVLQLKENVLLIQKYLIEKGLDIKYKKEIVNLKIFTRTESFKCENDIQWQQFWNSIFQDLSIFDVITDKYTSVKHKILYILAEMEIYRIIR